MTRGGAAIGWPPPSSARGDLVAIPAKRGEEAERQRAFIKDLRACLNRSRGRNRIAASLRDQLVGLVQHWFRHRMGMVHPGIAKMAEWAGVTEKQARNNARQLERWGVAIPVANQDGGRGNSTEYVIDLKALFSVLNLMGCRPTDFMRDFAAEKAEITLRILLSFPTVDRLETRKILAGEPEISTATEDAAKPGTPRGQNPEVKAEQTSARIRDNSGPLSQRHQPGDIPPSAMPAAGRSADASLSSFSLKKNSRGGCKADHSAQPGAATEDAREPGEASVAPNEFDLIACYPKQTFEVFRVQGAWGQAIEHGLKPQDLMHLAKNLRRQVEAGTLDVQDLPDLQIWLGKLTWPEPDLPAEAAE